jgi:hypothetical protein
MSGNDAARALEAIRPAAVCPVHVEGWSHFREDQAGFGAALHQRAANVRCHWLPPGVGVNLADLL